MNTEGALQFTQSDSTRMRKGGLDITVLGVCCGSGLKKLDCALVRYVQASPEALLQVELLQVRSFETSCTQNTQNE